MKKSRYLLAFASLISPLLFLSHPFFKTGWPLIFLSFISLALLFAYMFNKKKQDAVMERDGNYNLLIAWLVFMLMMSSLFFNYALVTAGMFEIALKFNINMKFIFIILVLICISILRICGKTILNFIK